MKPEEVLNRIGTLQPICFPGFEKAVKRADAFARSPSKGGDIALCLGPSGSGKSTLFNALKTSLFGAPETWLAGTKPVIHVELRNTNNAYFSSKWFSKALLTAVHDPFRALNGAIAQWDLPPDVASRLSTATTMLGKIRDHEGELQDAFVNVARAFQVKLIMVDEANMMCLTQRNRIPTDYLETLRCLSQAIGCAVMLFGSCDLIDMLNYSAQMNRREFIIAMERIESSGAEWTAFLIELEVELGIPRKILQSHAQDLYELSYGVPGEAIARIRDAAREALARKAASIEWEDFIASAPTEAAIDQMQHEAEWLTDSLKRYQSGEKSPSPPNDQRAASSEARGKRTRAMRRGRRWAVG